MGNFVLLTDYSRYGAWCYLPLSKFFRRGARVVFEEAAEIAVILFTDFIGNLADAQRRLFQQRLGFEQQHVIEDVVGGFAGSGVQAAVEVGLRDGQVSRVVSHGMDVVDVLHQRIFITLGEQRRGICCFGF